MPKGIRNKPAPTEVELKAAIAHGADEAAPASQLQPDIAAVSQHNPDPSDSVTGTGSDLAQQYRPPIGNDPAASGAALFTPEVIAPKAPAAPIEDLAAYAKRIERAAQPLAVCIITHPDAVDDTIFEGVYAGIRLVNGPEMSALLSDGSTI